MTLSRVEHALGMMRSYLVERAAQNDWDSHGPGELAEAIATCLQRSTEEARREAPRRDHKLSRDLLRRAIGFVNDNLDSKLKWDEIASDIGLDPFAFGRGFKLSTGMTPHQYVIRCRLRRAMRLLALNQLTLADVALEVGCSCQSHLTTLFRRHLGTTPGAFRASARENQQRVPHATATTVSTIANRRARLRQQSGVTEFRIRASFRLAIRTYEAPISILSSDFRYVPAVRTDLARTFARIRQEQRGQAKQQRLTEAASTTIRAATVKRRVIS